MDNGKITKLKIPSLNEFEFQIKYTETNQSNHVQEIWLHTHSEFELYVNLSGDVSFLVENNLYELTRATLSLAKTLQMPFGILLLWHETQRALNL